MANKAQLRKKQQSGAANAGPPLTMTSFMDDMTSADVPSAPAESDERVEELEARLQQVEAQIDEYEQTAIVPLEDGKFGFRRFEFTAVGIQVPDDITEIEVNDFLLALKEADDAIAWTVGDLANAAETKWGKTYDQLEKVTGYKYQTLADYAYVARQVNFSIRIEKLKFGHHRVVAAMDAAEQTHWLMQCDENKWSVAEFRRQIEESQRQPSRPRVVIDALHRDMLPKFGKVESVLKRALASKTEKDIAKAREQLYQARKVAEAYFEALEQELDDI